MCEKVSGKLLSELKERMVDLEEKMKKKRRGRGREEREREGIASGLVPSYIKPSKGVEKEC